MGKLERANKALAVSIILEHSVWKASSQSLTGGKTRRFCTAEGCTHEYLPGQIPTELARLSHAVDMLFKAGFDFKEG